jgi:hypothetical protein
MLFHVCLFYYSIGTVECSYSLRSTHVRKWEAGFITNILDCLAATTHTRVTVPELLMVARKLVEEKLMRIKKVQVSDTTMML